MIAGYKPDQLVNVWGADHALSNIAKKHKLPVIDIDGSHVLSELARCASSNIKKHIPHLQLHSSALKYQQLAHLQMKACTDGNRGKQIAT